MVMKKGVLVFLLVFGIVFLIGSIVAEEVYVPTEIYQCDDSEFPGDNINVRGITIITKISSGNFFPKLFGNDGPQIHLVRDECYSKASNKIKEYSCQGVPQSGSEAVNWFDVKDCDDGCDVGRCLTSNEAKAKAEGTEEKCGVIYFNCEWKWPWEEDRVISVVNEGLTKRELIYRAETDCLNQGVTFYNYFLRHSDESKNEIVFEGCGVECVPGCSGNECGDDGCGRSCGSCPSGESCDNGECVEECVPIPRVCEEKCGIVDNECEDVNCGSCNSDEKCFNNECVPLGDGPNSCVIKSDCDATENCISGKCVCTPAPQIPLIEGVCGSFDDGCGNGFFVDCPLGENCIGGSCVEETSVCGTMECGDGEVCVNNECVEYSVDPPLICTDNSDCGFPISVKLFDNMDSLIYPVCVDGSCFEKLVFNPEVEEDEGVVCADKDCVSYLCGSEYKFGDLNDTQFGDDISSSDCKGNALVKGDPLVAVCDGGACVEEDTPDVVISNRETCNEAVDENGIGYIYGVEKSDSFFSYGNLVEFINRNDCVDDYVYTYFCDGNYDAVDTVKCDYGCNEVTKECNPEPDCKTCDKDYADSECGTYDDGCGGRINCGGCYFNEFCNDDKKCEESDLANGQTCNDDKDGEVFGKRKNSFGRLYDYKDENYCDNRGNGYSFSYSCNGYESLKSLIRKCKYGCDEVTKECKTQTECDVRTCESRAIRFLGIFSSSAPECGNYDDECGGRINCGSCGSNEFCYNGKCQVKESCVESGIVTILTTYPAGNRHVEGRYDRCDVNVWTKEHGILDYSCSSSPSGRLTTPGKVTLCGKKEICSTDWHPFSIGMVPHCKAK